MSYRITPGHNASIFSDLKTLLTKASLFRAEDALKKDLASAHTIAWALISLTVRKSDVTDDSHNCVANIRPEGLAYLVTAENIFISH